MGGRFCPLPWPNSEGYINNRIIFRGPHDFTICRGQIVSGKFSLVTPFGFTLSRGLTMKGVDISPM